MIRVLGACALVLVALCATRTAALSQERALGVRRTVYVLEVDLARARKIGWASVSANDSEVLENAERIVRRRLVAMERSFDLRHDLEARRIELAMPQVQPRDRELFESMLASLGQCEILLLADDLSTKDIGIDLAAEKQKLVNWQATNQDVPLTIFDTLEEAQQGPHRRLLWARAVSGDTTRSQALLLPDKPEDHFGSGDFASCEPAQDEYGRPAFVYTLRDSRVDDLESWTVARLHQSMGIVLGATVRSVPTLTAKLGSRTVVEGRFTPPEIAQLTEAIAKKEGPLRVVEVR